MRPALAVDRITGDRDGKFRELKSSCRRNMLILWSRGGITSLSQYYSLGEDIDKHSDWCLTSIHAEMREIQIQHLNIQFLQ